MLLAGGASRRFPPNKLLVSYKGDPLFWRPLRALADVCSEIVLAAGASVPDPDLPQLRTPVRVVRDPAADEGPLFALASALPAVRTDWALLVGGDMPELEPALLRALVGLAADSSADAIALLDDDETARPMPALLRVIPARDAAERLVANGERRLRAVLKALETDVLAEPWWSKHDPAGAWRRDIDRPTDLL